MKLRAFRSGSIGQQIRVGDNIPAAIQRGLAGSRCGVVILSPRYSAKPWATAELEALLHRDIGGKQLLLSIHHDLTAEDIGDRAPLIAPKLGLPWNVGLAVIVPEAIAALSRQVVPKNFSASATAGPVPAPPAQPLALVLIHERATVFVEGSRVEAVSLTAA